MDNQQDDTSLHTTNSDSSVALSPHEETLQELCKRILKSRFFRGVYEERHYVASVDDYRDIVSLHRSERDLQKLLLDVLKELNGFYLSRKPNIWIGITHGALTGSSRHSNTLDTFVWVELNDYAFGPYWFSIKSIRFRDNEILLKLKVVRRIGAEADTLEYNRLVSRTVPLARGIPHKTVDTNRHQETSTSNTVVASETPKQELPNVDFKDFIAILQTWGTTIKTSAYNFMSNDINKDNIKGACRFLGLLLLSVCTGLIVGIKYLGVFTLRFMFECSRIAHVMTPIILKLMDVINKIIGGFYILLAMIWKDTVINRGKSAPKAIPQIEYRRPVLKSMDYRIRPAIAQSRVYTSPVSGSEFERKFQ